MDSTKTIGANMSGGRRTKHGGRMLEEIIRSLTLKDFSRRSYSEYKKEFGGLFPPEARLLIERYPYPTMFGTKGYREYYLATKEWSGQLECKYQNESGSVDEKLVYVTETFRRDKEPAMAIVYGGDYWESGRGRSVIQWLRQESVALHHTHNKDLRVHNTTQFYAWVKKTWK
jgi:hypothetical protein